MLDESAVVATWDAFSLTMPAKMEAREKELEQKRHDNPMAGRRHDARRSAMPVDQEAWEENRLLSSGTAIQGEVSLDVRTEQDTCVTLLVH